MQRLAQGGADELPVEDLVQLHIVADVPGGLRPDGRMNGTHTY